MFCEEKWQQQGALYLAEGCVAFWGEISWKVVCHYRKICKWWTQEESNAKILSLKRRRLMDTEWFQIQLRARGGRCNILIRLPTKSLESTQTIKHICTPSVKLVDWVKVHIFLLTASLLRLCWKRQFCILSPMWEDCAVTKTSHPD